jgi:hypothetical protein
MLAAIALGCDVLNPEPPPKPVSNWTVEDARKFDEFPLYWLGADYEGLPLTSMHATTDGDGVHHASFAYGDPEYYGDGYSGSWLSPLEIDIQTQCGWSPKEFLSHYRDESEQVAVRDVTAYARYYQYGWSYLTLWSGASAISISATPGSEAKVRDAAEDLFPIAEDHGEPEAVLPQPVSTEC